MLSLLSIPLGLFIFVLAKKLRDLSINIAKAKKTGFPYVVVPYWGWGTSWTVITEVLRPLFLKLPFSENWEWLKFVDRNLSWHLPRWAEDKYGDTFLIVSPWVCQLKTSDAPLAAQIVTRRDDFPKPVEEYTLVGLFGKSIISWEGQDWRRHKRIVGGSFNEKSNKLVFEESLRQAEGMLQFWQKEDVEGDRRLFRVPKPAKQTTVLSVHVICKAGFGVPQVWPHQSEDLLKEDIMGSFGGRKLMTGHTLSLKGALNSVLENMMFYALLPRWLLKHLPSENAKQAAVSYDECLAYFYELVAATKEQISLGVTNEESTMDLLRPMIQASSLLEEGSEKPPLNNGLPSNSGVLHLSESELIGNAFIFLFAGHETTANTIHFTTLYLVLYPEYQRALQAQVDTIVGTLPSSQWDYHVHMPKLYNSLVGAVINEQLRLLPPLPDIPKLVEADQIVRVDGRNVVIPEGLSVILNSVGANRNPKYWKSRGDGDLDEFWPERWIPSSSESAVDDIPIPAEEEESKKATLDSSQDEPEPEGLTAPSFLTQTSTSLRPPQKGAFLSFSEGPRACPGRRFAQVEATAVLASIFQRYTVEFDVRKWATDEEVRKMNKSERAKLHKKVSDEVQARIRDCDLETTPKLRKGEEVPLRFVERGGEIFF